MWYTKEFPILLKRIHPGDLKAITVDYTTVNGNAYSLMGHFSTEAKRSKWTKEDIKIVTDECMSNDYDHFIIALLEVAKDFYADVQEDEVEEDYTDPHDPRKGFYEQRNKSIGDSWWDDKQL